MTVAGIISVLLLLSLALLAWCLLCIIRGRQSRTWPSVTGRILECRMESDGDGEMPSMRVRVRYAYEVEGRQFEGSRVAYGYCGGTLQAEHQKLYDNLYGVSQVRVHYQPGRPDRSVLETGIHRLTFVALTFAIIWVSVMSAAAFGWYLYSGQEQPLDAGARHLSNRPAFRPLAAARGPAMGNAIAL